MLVLNYDNEPDRKLASRAASRVFFFSTEEKLEKGAWIEEGNFVFDVDGLEACGLQGVRSENFWRP